MKKPLFPLLLILPVIILSGCSAEESSPSFDPGTIAVSEKLGVGDSKFYREKILTSLGGVSGLLTLVEPDGTVDQTYENISACWMDVMEEESLLVYGNFLDQIGIAHFDESYNITDNTIVMATENLQIDPSIEKLDGTWYMTVTEVIGSINNSDPEAENGEYILHFYSSEDLTHWKWISDLADEKHNIEDVDFSISDGIFYVVYEKEDVDKGNSAIEIRRSSDKGQSWSEETVLLAADSDHEPATFEKYGDGFILYYSCDREDPGSSYNGAKAYYALYDRDLKLIKKDQPLPTQTEKGILLYDTKETDSELTLLYARNKMTDSDLVTETLTKSS